MVRVEPIVLVEKAEEVTLTKENRCAIDAMAEIVIFPGSIRQFNYIDILLPNRDFYFGRRIRIVENNEMLDRLIALIAPTLSIARKTDKLPVVGVTTVTRGFPILHGWPLYKNFSPDIPHTTQILACMWKR